MKRYVKEYANDRIDTLKDAYSAYGNAAAMEAIKEIREIVRFCERGYISAHEAVKEIGKY